MEPEQINLKSPSGGEEAMLGTENYDPHMHRNKPKPTTNIETLIHLLKGCLGTGILAMPQAFHHSGWLSGLISTLIIGAICNYLLIVLVRSQYMLCKKKGVAILSYPESMKAALEIGPQPLRRFAWISPLIVDGFLIVYQLGICCVYIMFTAENIKQVIDAYLQYSGDPIGNTTSTNITEFSDVESDNSYNSMSVSAYSATLLIPLLAIVSIRGLKLLAPLSALANVLTFIGIIITAYFIIPVVIQDYSEGQESKMHAFGLLRDYALYFGTTLFALEAVGVVIAVENNMATPKSFASVLTIAMAVVTVLYALMGIAGYAAYGSNAEGSITLNLPQNDLLAQAVKLVFAIAIFISYGLQAYVPVEIIWTTYMEKKIKGHKLLWEYLLRFAVVLVTLALAISIPRLGLFISLFGCLCLSTLGLTFPAIIEVCVLWPDKLGRYNYILHRNIFFGIFGLIGLVVGTYTSIYDIIQSL